ncbi:Uncharacterized protein TCM_018865 [Theobroma cacao]|uniref:Rapid ALkalinization Factor n=1 Tax=Theobroma cacao TaxID=3641 RepID=A0A061EN49_THECC|nr:Uncharacterized protein TCM_018865 [Theobroma cacao]
MIRECWEMENMGDSWRICGNFNLAMLVLMVIMMLLSTNHCSADAVKNNKSISDRCNGSKNECLLPDDVEMELLMDSEASKMVLETSAAGSADSKRATYLALDPLCGRHSGKSCLPQGNLGRKVPPNCRPNSYNKDCHRF